jgi:hypothetical protein
MPQKPSLATPASRPVAASVTSRRRLIERLAAIEGHRCGSARTLHNRPPDRGLRVIEEGTVVDQLGV